VTPSLFLGLDYSLAISGPRCGRIRRTSTERSWLTYQDAYISTQTILASRGHRFDRIFATKSRSVVTKSRNWVITMQNKNGNKKTTTTSRNFSSVKDSFLIVVITLLHHTFQDTSDEASLRVTYVSMRLPFLDELLDHLMRCLRVLCPGTFVDGEVRQHVRSRFCRQQSDCSYFQILLRQRLTDRFFEIHLPFLTFQG
jgi:hypothetical protein